MYNIIEGFFKVDSLYKTFYDIIISQDSIYIVNVGQTYRAWLVNSDISYIKRNEMTHMSLEDICEKFDVIKINKQDIVEINYKARTFVKNAVLNIKTVNDELNFYSDKTYNNFNVNQLMVN